MNKEQAIKLFEGLIEDTERAKKSWGTGDTGYYTSEALISAYNLAISVVKVMDVGEQPKQDKPVVKPFDEPQAEKVEVPEFVAEWLENHPDAKELSSKFNWWNLSAVCGGYISDPEYIFAGWFNDKANSYGNRRTLLKAILDGYTVTPKRWVVKKGRDCILTSFTFFSEDLVNYDSNSYGKDYMYFTNRAKAEAVATLIDGSVEEV